jgi:hypothetical protein
MTVGQGVEKRRREASSWWSSLPIDQAHRGRSIRTMSWADRWLDGMWDLWACDNLLAASSSSSCSVSTLDKMAKSGLGSSWQRYGSTVIMLRLESSAAEQDYHGEEQKNVWEWSSKVVRPQVQPRGPLSKHCAANGFLLKSIRAANCCRQGEDQASRSTMAVTEPPWSDETISFVNLGVSGAPRRGFVVVWGRHLIRLPRSCLSRANSSRRY